MLPTRRVEWKHSHFTTQKLDLMVFLKKKEILHMKKSKAAFLGIGL